MSAGLVLIVSERRLRFGDKEVLLTQQVSNLAARLLRTAPDIVPTGDLRRAVWPVRGDEPGNALRDLAVCKSVLRRQIAYLDAPVWLKTWRSVGCRLIPADGHEAEIRSALFYEGVRFYQDAGSLSHRDGWVKLKPQVAAAAGSLLRNPRFVSDAMLREALWPNAGRRPEHETDVRKMVISNVRKALREVSAPLHVERVAGGYRLAVTRSETSPAKAGTVALQSWIGEAAAE